MSDPKSRPSGLDTVPKLLPGIPSSRPAPARPRRTRGRYRAVAIVAGLMAASGIAWLGYREWDPPLLREAAVAYRRGDLAVAYSKAIEHLASRPMSRSAALIAARSLGRLGRLAEAEPYYRKAGPISLDALHARAFALIQARLYDQADAVYGEILARSPEDVQALRRLAVAHILRSRWDDALEVAARLKRFPQGEVIGYTLAGVVYHDTARPDAAVVEFEKVASLDPDLSRMPLEPRWQFWVYFTKDLVELGLGDRARIYLARALAERQDPLYYDLLGESYWQEGEIEAAERSWMQSIEVNSGRVRPWLSLGNLELQRGRVEAAIERLGRASKLAPGAREPAYSLSQAYARLGRREEADRYRILAERLRPQIHKPPPGMGGPKSP